MRRINSGLLTGFCGVLLLLAGCAGTSPPSRFYVLSAMEPSPGGAEATRDIGVGVGPLVIPDYLDRPQIVVREDANRVGLEEFDRWAGPLRGNVLSVLTENLSALLSADRVLSYPWTTGLDLDYQVEMEISRFEASRDGTVSLQARWLIRDLRDNRVLKIGSSKATASADGSSFDSMVAAQSQLLEAMSKNIADAILGLGQSPDKM